MNRLFSSASLFFLAAALAFGSGARERDSMQDTAAERTLLGKGFDLGHEIVLDLSLDLVGALDIHVSRAGP